MNRIIKFGEDVEGFEIPVLNEREIRAAAGILFLLMFTAFLAVIMKGNYIYLKYGIIIFLMDFSIRVLISPRYAPTLILGRLIVSNQMPEFVGARQKKFAWKIGLFMAITMFTILIVFNSRTPVNLAFCIACLTFLFFESAFGICLGCMFYPYFSKEKLQYCPGEVCDLKSKHEIQKTSFSQLIVLLTFIVLIMLTAALFRGSFLQPPAGL